MSTQRKLIQYSSASFLGGALLSLLATWLIYNFQYQPRLDDSSISILKERLEELGPLSAKQQKILAEEIARVKKYERKLATRSKALDALLENTLELDQSKESSLLDGISHESSLDDAMGGALEHLAPVLHSGTSKRDSLASRKVNILPVKSNLIHRLDHQIKRLEDIPLGAPSVGRISSKFGPRRSPFSRRWQTHKGIDFALDSRSPVIATAKGVVKEAGYMSGYGRVVVIDHQNGFETVYGHLSKILVKAGSTVCRGERIGLVGSLGRSTGPHVHYEIRLDSKPLNPAPFIDLVTFLRFI